MKRWMLTAKVLIEQPVDGETKTEATVKGVNAITEAFEGSLLKAAKIVVTSASVTEQK